MTGGEERLARGMAHTCVGVEQQALDCRNGRRGQARLAEDMRRRSAKARIEVLERLDEAGRCPAAHAQERGDRQSVTTHVIH